MTLPKPPHDLPSLPDNRWRRLISFVLFALLVVGASGWRYRSTRPEFRLARGDAAIREKDWTAAEQYAARLEASGHPDPANVLRGEVLMARGRPDQALAAFNRVSPAAAVRRRAGVGSGKCLLALKQFREAYRVFLVVADEDPNNADAHRGLAAAAYDMGQLSVAGTHLQRVAELDPTDSRPHRLIGLIHKDLSQWPEAVAGYREALRRGPPDEVRREVRGELAAVLVHQANYAEALAELDAEPQPDSADWLATRGESLRGLGKRSEAAELVDRALAKHTTARLLRLRGQLFLDDTRSADAVPPLERAVTLTPTDYEARYLLAQALASVGRKDDAAREFARVEALKKDFTALTELSREAMEKPWDAGVRLRLAELCDKLEKPQLAAMWRSAAGQGR